MATVLIVGLMVGIMCGAPDLVSLTLDASFTPLKLVVPILAVWGACRALGGISSSAFMAVGRPACVPIYQLVMLVIIAVCVYPATLEGGVVGVAGMFAVVGLTAQALRYGLVSRILGVPLLMLQVRVATPFLLAAVAVAAGFGCRAVANVGGNILGLVLTPAVGLLIYALGVLAWDRWTGVGVLDAVWSLKGKRTSRHRRLPVPGDAGPLVTAEAAP